MLLKRRTKNEGYTNPVDKDASGSRFVRSDFGCLWVRHTVTFHLSEEWTFSMRRFRWNRKEIYVECSKLYAKVKPFGYALIMTTAKNAVFIAFLFAVKRRNHDGELLSAKSAPNCKACLLLPSPIEMAPGLHGQHFATSGFSDLFR